MVNASAWETYLRGGKSFDEAKWRSPKVSPSRIHQYDLPKILFLLLFWIIYEGCELFSLKIEEMDEAKDEGRKKVSCVRCVHRGEILRWRLKCQSVRSSAGLPYLAARGNGP